MNHHNKTVVGLDVHKETIVGVSLFPDGQVDQRFQIKNRPEFVSKMIDVLKKRHGSLECVYDAGPASGCPPFSFAKAVSGARPPGKPDIGCGSKPSVSIIPPSKWPMTPTSARWMIWNPS